MWCALTDPLTALDLPSQPHPGHSQAPACLRCIRCMLQTRGVGPPQHPIPAEARAVARRIEALPGAVAVDQLTVNEYAPGVGISPHVGEPAPGPELLGPGAVAARVLWAGASAWADVPARLPAETHSAFTGAIASLSLAGTAAMVLRKDGEPPRALFLPPRSLLLLAGELAGTPLLHSRRRWRRCGWG